MHFFVSFRVINSAELLVRVLHSTKCIGNVTANQAYRWLGSYYFRQFDKPEFFD